MTHPHRPDMTLLVVAGTANMGRCKYCRRSIVWVTLAAQNGQRAKPQSFNHRAIDPPTQTNDAGVRFEHWPEADRHRHTCSNWPKPDRTRARFRQDSRTGQGRMW